MLVRVAVAARELIVVKALTSSRLTYPTWLGFPRASRRSTNRLGLSHNPACWQLGLAPMKQNSRPPMDKSFHQDQLVLFIVEDKVRRLRRALICPCVHLRRAAQVKLTRAEIGGAAGTISIRSASSVDHRVAAMCERDGQAGRRWLQFEGNLFF